MTVPTVVLLHGLGATGAVWLPVETELRARGISEILSPDLPGHGAADALPAYTLEEIARALAPLLPIMTPFVVVGHSLGGYVALALAEGRTSRLPTAAMSIGAKLVFSPQDRQRATDLAARPAQTFTSRAAALERYRKLAGLPPSIAPDERCLARGVSAGEFGTFRLTQDPRTFAIEVPPFASLLEIAMCPVAICRGEGDTLVSDAEYRALGRPFDTFAAVGHNAHVEAPGVVADAIVTLCGRARNR